MRKKIWMMAMALLLLVGSLSACAPKLSIEKEEALAVLQDLVPRSYEINVIFFGAGLPAQSHAGEGAAAGAIYYPVTSDCGYRSTAEIKKAAEKIYSKRYLDGIYVAAFIGTTAESADGGADLSISPRYRDLTDQGLCVNITTEPIAIRGRLTVEAVSVGKRTSTYVMIEATCRDETGNTLTIDIPLAKQNGVWLLDGPTY